MKTCHTFLVFLLSNFNKNSKNLGIAASQQAQEFTRQFKNISLQVFRLKVRCTLSQRTRSHKIPFYLEFELITCHPA